MGAVSAITERYWEQHDGVMDSLWRNLEEVYSVSTTGERFREKE